jgi:predicted phosphodiesterase
MLVAVFGDSHAHADALDAVIRAAEGCGVEELWSLGDMVGGGPDPERVVARTRERCRVALMGNHDYAVTGASDPLRFGEPGSAAVRSLELAADRVAPADIAWMRSRRPAARRADVQCWHGGPHNAVHEYVGPSNAAACLATQRAQLGLVGHTHEPAAWEQMPDGRARRTSISPGVPLDVSRGKWMLNPGAVGAPAPSRLAWWDGLHAQAHDGAFWLLLDLDERTATWHRAAYDPLPARERARALGLESARSATQSSLKKRAVDSA